jgi:hypothetical protein
MTRSLQAPQGWLALVTLTEQTLWGDPPASQTSADQVVGTLVRAVQVIGRPGTSWACYVAVNPGPPSSFTIEPLVDGQWQPAVLFSDLSPLAGADLTVTADAYHPDAGELLDSAGCRLRPDDPDLLEKSVCG